LRFADLFSQSRDGLEVLRARFQKFRHLLDINNRILWLFADADEKLGGEYLFDRQYLRWLEHELSTAASAAVQDLAEISDDRYPRLAGALERIQAAVHACLQPHETARELPLTLAIEDLGTEHADVVGEKMARLAEVRRQLASSVPDGFAVTIRACELLLEQPNLADLLRKYRAGQQTVSSVQAAITAAKPPSEVAKAIKEALSRFGRDARFAVRSSAVGEDSELSFAGQHATVLNVPRDRVLDAWLEVVASLFSAQASEYRVRHSFPSAESDMAVGVLLMVPAAASGVIYTVDPMAPGSGALVVSATRGLGVPVVEGRKTVDRFELSRATPHTTLNRRIADKQEMCQASPEGGVRSEPVAAELRNAPAIDDQALAALAEAALKIERHMKSPEDIEWTLDDHGAITILQARPLRVGPEAQPRTEDVLAACRRHRILMQNQGEVACRGVGTGRVFVLDANQSTEGFLPGDVLVTPVASPSLSVLLADASALVSDAGSVTGHLATVSREYRVPAIVDTRDAMHRLQAGSVVTVDADEKIIYEGNVDELVRYQLLRSQPYQEAAEFRILRRMLKHAAPLTLRDPSVPGFTPENCRTYHDIIRFAHERALLELGRLEGIKLDGRQSRAQELQLDIALDLAVIDLDGALAQGASGNALTPAQVSSRPLSLLLEGLLAPGVWSTNPAEMDLDGFMASATRAGPLTVPGSGGVRRNVAIISANYLNLNLRLGYHFNVVDCYLGEHPEESYIFFRFVGGVTDVTRRTRRARLLANILSRQGFKIELSGELIVARLQGAPLAVCEDRMRMIGRLIGFTRQLDILLRDDPIVDKLTTAFLESGHQSLDDLTRSAAIQTNIEVLVLDDEPIVCERVKDYLEKNGIQVETFTDSAKAIERLAQKQFHVVITDLKMKAPTGIDVMVAIKSRELPTEVIVITGHRTMEATHAAECVGAYGFLDKPFHMDELRDLVKKAAKKAEKHAAGRPSVGGE
jgi:pyruvate,water dikinase